MTSNKTAEIERRFAQSQNDLVLQASDFSLQGLKEMVDGKTIDLSPQYQRRERWEPKRQSQLIESFLLNVPVPPLYLAEEEYGIYSIIDGKQRITTVSDFLNGKFRLAELEEFPELIGLRFSDLPKTLQGALKIRPYFRVITLLKQSRPQLKYEVFLRLNRGGIQLNNQEIRNVAFKGRMNDSIYLCAKNELLCKALKIDGPRSAAYQQMQDAEYVLRFMTLYKEWQTYTGNFAKAMDEFMLENQNVSEAKAAKFRVDFTQAVGRVQEIWGEYAFQRWDGEKWRQQTLAGLYDAQMIAASSLTKREMLGASNNRSGVVKKTRALFEEAEFEEAVRVGTNIPSRLRLRVERTLAVLRSFS